MQKLFLILGLFGAAFAAPSIPVSSRIVGGSDVAIEKYPFMGLMQFHWWDIIWSQACASTLISLHTMLSAAHCYVGDSPSQWRVRLGTSHASGDGRLFYVSELIKHPSYNDETLDNDLVVIKLSSIVQLSMSVGLAGIVGVNYGINDGTKLDTVGWGTIDSNGDSNALPDFLQHAEVSIINQETCANRYEFLTEQPGYSKWPIVTDRMICVGVLDRGGRSPCVGDSGSPLVIEGNVVGVVSWGYGCGHPFFPTVATRLSYFTDWIIEKLVASPRL